MERAAALLRHTDRSVADICVMVGLQSVEKMTALIDEELAKARERVAAGTAPARYYQDWVMGRGLKKLAPARL